MDNDEVASEAPPNLIRRSLHSSITGCDLEGKLFERTWKLDFEAAISKRKRYWPKSFKLEIDQFCKFYLGSSAICSTCIYRYHQMEETRNICLLNKSRLDNIYDSDWDPDTIAAPIMQCSLPTNVSNSFLGYINLYKS
ncbi:hypothetical protein TorRG33x02_281510 [Trema orientale]|uniref:Uncharacterized protein n=1 Tax=Trema orientale TaxID=63057 RepID=A0A2P5CKC5_TREOI|nr:hypothetical protein TorRG33x02_281510 [Trema orientale]